MGGKLRALRPSFADRLRAFDEASMPPPKPTGSNRRGADRYARWCGWAAPRGSPARDPKVSDLLAAVCSCRRYEVSGALEHAPKFGVGSQADSSISAGSIRREARAVRVVAAVHDAAPIVCIMKRLPLGKQGRHGRH